MNEPRNIARLTEAVALVASLVFVIAVIATAYEVGARYLFGRPTVWAHEATIFLCAIGYLAGGVYTMVRDDHIRITVLHERLPLRWRRAVDVFNMLVSLAFLLALAWSATIAGSRALAGWETTGSAWNPPIPALVTPLIAICAIAMIPFLLLNLRTRLRR